MGGRRESRINTSLMTSWEKSLWLFIFKKPRAEGKTAARCWRPRLRKLLLHSKACVTSGSSYEGFWRSQLPHASYRSKGLDMLLLIVAT